MDSRFKIMPECLTFDFSHSTLSVRIIMLNLKSPLCLGSPGNQYHDDALELDEYFFLNNCSKHANGTLKCQEFHAKWPNSTQKFVKKPANHQATIAMTRSLRLVLFLCTLFC